MTYDEVMSRLEALGDEKMRAMNARHGAGENQFGIKTSDLRGLAKEIKANPELAAELWVTGNTDAMRLATLLMKPKLLSTDDLDRLVASTPNSPVADWLVTNVIKPHAQKDTLREKWMDSEHEITRRLGWSLTTERVIKDPQGLDLPGLLDRIEAELDNKRTEGEWSMHTAQWTMNYCLAEIGINHPEYRDRAMALGEKIGAFRDYPVSKGCVSPFAPIWIAEMVKRAG